MLASLICRMNIKKTSCSSICERQNPLRSLDLVSSQPPHLMRSRPQKKRKEIKQRKGQSGFPMVSTCALLTTLHIHTHAVACIWVMLTLYDGWRMPFLSLLLHELCRGRHSLALHRTSAGWTFQVGVVTVTYPWHHDTKLCSFWLWVAL